MTLPAIVEVLQPAARRARSDTREGRVKLTAEVAAALLDGRQPSPEAALFVGAALQRLLETGKFSLDLHERGSHRTVQRLFQSMLTSSISVQPPSSA